MYKSTFITAFYIYISISNLFAQQIESNLANLLELDTLVYFQSLVSDEMNFENIIIKNNDDLILILTTNHSKDSLQIKMVNKQTFVIDSVSIYINSLANQLKNSKISDAEWQIDHGVLLIDNYLYKINMKDLAVDRILLDQVYENCKILNNKNLLLYRSYNYYQPIKDMAKTQLVLFDLNSNKIIKTIKPHITNIELSNMGPYHTIYATKSMIIVGQNYNKSFTIYDDSLNILASYIDSVNYTKQLDSNVINDISNKNKADRTAIIQYLQPKFLSGYSFSDGYWLLENGDIFIRYADENIYSDSIYRLYSVLKFDRETRKFSKLKSEFYTTIFDYNQSKNDLVSTKSNTFFSKWPLNKFIPDDYKSVIVRYGIDFYPIGNKFSDIKKREYEYELKKPLILTVAIFKNRF
jgi:hypothetical protein